MLDKIGIVGFGYVGSLMYDFFKDYYSNKNQLDSIFINDNNTNYDSIEKINENCEIVFICVPTPALPNGLCDISIVESVVKALTKVNIIVIKSTIGVGTTELLNEKYNNNIVFSPEYAGESSYWSPYKFDNSMIEEPFYIFGGDKEICSQLIDLYSKIAGPVKKYVICSSREAEMTKYIENSFFAAKVSLCNEFYDICEKANLDYNVVRELWLLDPRINKMHTLVFKNSRGYGGKCYPKDISALISYSEKIGAKAEILKSVKKYNNTHRDNEI